MAGSRRFTWMLMVLPALCRLSPAQSTLEITSPENGTLVYTGHVLGVTVTASGAPPENVVLIGTDPIGISKLLTAPPYVFDVEIPETITPGPYQLTAASISKSGPLVGSQPITIDVEREDQPQKITTNWKQLRFNVGDQSGIGVTGTYADGSMVDLSRSSRTTYATQNPAIATVTKEGFVTAIAPGATEIVIDESVSIPVTVEPFIHITPDRATIKASQTRYFVARVTRPPSGKVTWSLNPSVGSVVDGKYTAPEALDSEQKIAITATSVDDPGLSATAMITLSPAASIEVAPNWAVLYQSQTRQFTATAANAGSQDVRWSVTPPEAGSISATGLYTAPAAISKMQPVKITAASAANPAISGSSTIYISSRPFKMLLWHPELRLVPGTSNSTKITLLATDRFMHPIALSVDGAPIGIRTTLTDQTLLGNTDTTLTFTYENETVPARYRITITAFDTTYAPLVDTETLILDVGPAGR